MTAQLIDGKAIAAQIYKEIRAEVAELKEKHGITPGLATVLVGENPASQSYVRSKQRTCTRMGFHSIGEHMPEDATQEEVEDTVKRLNADPSIHGILVQLPLPRHLDEEKILAVISLAKDVDGFSPVNIGRLTMKGREPLFVPCTPAGCVQLLDRSGVTIEGAEAVVLGRSNIVGLPRYSDRRGRASQDGESELDQAGGGRDRCRHQSRGGCHGQAWVPAGGRCGL